VTKAYNTAEGIADNTAISTGNSGGASGTAWDQVTNTSGGSIQAEADAAVHGSRGIRVVSVSGSSNILIKNITAPSGEAAISFYFDAPASAPTANTQIATIRHSSGNMAILALTTANKLVCQDATGGAAITPTPTLTAGATYRAEMRVKKGTTTGDGVRQFAYFLGDSTTAEHASTNSATNTGTADPASLRFGRPSSSTWANTLDLDSIQWDDAPAGALMGPWVGSNFAPAAGISADQSVGVEPGQTVTLTLTDSDADGTVVTRTVTQTGGTTVTLSGSGGTRTFDAPYTLAGTTLDFSYVVVDDDGASSDVATATVAVLAATERIVTVGGASPVEVPALISNA
jgi:hypothetical protein